MTRVYDPSIPWREQIDASAVEAMARREAPAALKRLGVERILTVKRMIDAYGAGDLSLDELIALSVNYDMGLSMERPGIGDDPPLSPEEGCVSWDLYTADMEGRISGGDYDAIGAAMTERWG